MPSSGIHVVHVVGYMMMLTRLCLTAADFIEAFLMNFLSYVSYISIISSAAADEFKSTTIIISVPNTNLFYKLRFKT